MGKFVQKSSWKGVYIDMEIGELYNYVAGFGLNSHYPLIGLGLWPEEQQRLMWCQYKAPNLNSLVIGSHNGGSEAVLGLVKNDKEDSSDIISADIKYGEFYGLIKNRIRNKLNREIVTWTCNSSNLNKRYNQALDNNEINGALGLVFVDGYHSYSQAILDVNQIKEFLAPGSIVCFHDCSPKPIKKGSKIPAGYVSQDEDFLVDEAINTILEENPEFSELEIPIGQNCDRRVQAGRDRYIRGQTSPFNSLFAIVKHV